MPKRTKPIQNAEEMLLRLTQSFCDYENGEILAEEHERLIKTNNAICKLATTKLMHSQASGTNQGMDFFSSSNKALNQPTVDEAKQVGDFGPFNPSKKYKRPYEFVKKIEEGSLSQVPNEDAEGDIKDELLPEENREKIERPPAEYSNNKSLYPELNQTSTEDPS